MSTESFEKGNGLEVEDEAKIYCGIDLKIAVRK
jgi:hypothetical protein